MKHWWGITGFECAISGTPSSVDIVLRGYNTTPFTSPCAQVTKNHPKHFAVMDVAQIYAIVAGSLFGILTTVNFFIHLWTALQTNTAWILRHIVYRFVLRRHRLVGPWSLRGFLLFCLYILTNIFCSVYGTNSKVEAGKRTGILSLINLMPLYFGPHLGFLAKLLGVSLHDIHTVHRSAAVMSVALSTTHALFSVFGGQWNLLARFPRLYALIVRLIICSYRDTLRTVRVYRHLPYCSSPLPGVLVDRPTSCFCEPIKPVRCFALMRYGGMSAKSWCFLGCTYTSRLESLR